jgi:bifunctional non-homologous end joining protein LigD
VRLAPRLHVVCPLDRSADFDDTRAFARDVADVVASRDPERLTTERRKEKRCGRLYLDTARNAYAQTAVAPYAVRARPGAPVATPRDWAELGKRGFSPERYTVHNVLRRLGRKGDPWAAIRKRAAPLDPARRRLDEIGSDAPKQKR